MTIKIIYQHRVSIVMAVYNGENYIAIAIKSLLEQSLEDFELIIIDDCSTDNTVNIVLSFSDKRIRFIRNDQNLGLTKSLNKGAALARGEFIARMDADDISAPDRLFKQLEFMDENRNIALIGTWAEIIDRKENKVAEWQRPIKDRDIKFALFYHNPMIHSSLFFRKKEFMEIGSYLEKYSYSQDYDMIVRMSKRYRLANLPAFCVKLRKHDESIGAKSKNEQLACAKMIKIHLIADFVGSTTEEAENFVVALDKRGLNISELFNFFKMNRKILKNFRTSNGISPSIMLMHREKNYMCLKNYLKNSIRWK